MGLDIVELIMRVEETFEIEIPDEEASELNTVGKLYQFILERLGFELAQPCPSSAVFYQTRRALLDLSGVTRNQIAPKTALSDLLPAHNRKQYWMRLSQKLALRLPDLIAPSWVTYSITCSFFMFWIVALASAVTLSPYTGVFFFIGSFAFLWLAHKVTSPLAIYLPSGCDTVSDLVKVAMRLNYGLPQQRKKTWHQAEVWETLKGVIAEELAVPVEKVNEDADLIRDLGAD